MEFIHLEQKEFISELKKIRLIVTFYPFNNLLLVRVGGGYLSIDEFID
jgi:hypothetical protein